MILPVEIWTKKAREHESRVRSFTDPYLVGRNNGRKHPIYDFLFTYYTFSPSKLKHWVPSVDMALEFKEEHFSQYPWLKGKWFQVEEKILKIDVHTITARTLSLLKFIADLCRNILDRPPRFTCYGLHEWAMIYQSSEETIRHQGIPLRLTLEALNHFVESQKICCSHYDAYRFFTPNASPLNILKPTLASRSTMEQGGCVHTNMDLYKWASKLWPWIGSDFIARTFFHAVEGRVLDMRASPYDFTEMGFEPICIETEEGRRLYQQEQQKLANRATLLRQELLNFCESFCENKGGN